MPFADEVQTLRLRKLEIMDTYREEALKLEQALADKLAMLDRILVQLADTSDEIPCLVRTTPGPDLTIYHSVDAPCRRVHSRRNFAEMPETEAKDASPYAYLTRCTACRWDRAALIHGDRTMKIS